MQLADILPSADIVLQDVVWRLSNYSHIYNQVAAAFPAENILVLNGNTLVEDPLTEIRKVGTANHLTALGFISCCSRLKPSSDWPSSTVRIISSTRTRKKAFPASLWLKEQSVWALIRVDLIQVSETQLKIFSR